MRLVYRWQEDDRAVSLRGSAKGVTVRMHWTPRGTDRDVYVYCALPMGEVRALAHALNQHIRYEDRRRCEQCGGCAHAVWDGGDRSVGMDASLMGCGHVQAPELSDADDGLCVQVPCPCYEPCGEDDCGYGFDEEDDDE